VKKLLIEKLTSQYSSVAFGEQAWESYDFELQKAMLCP